MADSGRGFRTVLITGIGGSGGSYLADYVLENHPDVDVHGIARWHSSTQDRQHGIRRKAQVHEADLADFGSTLEVLRKVRPDAIFHLAAHANVRASFITPQSVLANNVLGTSALLEAVRMTVPQCWFQMCSTSEVYGIVDPADVPIRESTSFRPASPYAVSKVAQDLLGYSYFVSYGMNIIRTRMFTYINPRRSDLFATAFARQVARIEAGLQDELLHGNLDSVRTMIDVRDAMSAYWIALERCRPGEAYNIGGTKTMKVGDFLETLRSLATVPVRARVNPELLRPADVTLQIPDTSKFAAETGWSPRYSFEESLAFLLDYWRKRVRAEASAE